MVAHFTPTPDSHPSPAPESPVIAQDASGKGHSKEISTRKAYSRYKKLTRAEERFALLRARGWPGWRCILEVTGTKAKKKTTLEVMCWKWTQRPAVAAEIERQRLLLDDATALQRTEKRNLLATLAREETTPPSVRVTAIQTDNQMTGDSEPMKLSVSGYVVFTVDPIGDGTRGQKKVTGTAETVAPAPEQTVTVSLAR